MSDDELESMFTTESLRKQSNDDLLLQNMFWQNRCIKEFENMDVAISVVEQLGLWKKIISSHREN